MPGPTRQPTDDDLRGVLNDPKADASKIAAATGLSVDEVEELMRQAVASAELEERIAPRAASAQVAAADGGATVGQEMSR